MVQIHRALKELMTTLVLLKSWGALLDTLTVLALGVLVAALINLTWYYAFVLVVPYAVIHWRTELKRASYASVEEKVPHLQEALRTSADYVDSQNEIALQLHEEVVKKLKEVKMSYFLGLGRATRRLITIAILCFAIIAVSAFGITIFDATSAVQAPAKSFRTVTNLFAGNANISIPLPENESEIYGNASLLELGREELMLELTSAYGGININDVKPPEKHDFTDEQAGEIAAATDRTFEENIDKEHVQIVKKYFSQISR